jgi:hypothetical protein
VSPAPVAIPVCACDPAVENGACHPFRREAARFYEQVRSGETVCERLGFCGLTVQLARLTALPRAMWTMYASVRFNRAGCARGLS